MDETGKTYAGRYRIVEEVGRGGMAVVYRAIDERMQRTVALKVLYPYLAMKEENKVRFEREAHVVASLDHRNVVRIYDYSGTDSPENYIVAEFVEGTTLKRFITDRPDILPEVAALMVEQLAAALAYAHDQGITHRDVKPENVMIGPDGVLKLMDFGIAQIKDIQHMTVTGTMIGSPAHMSPEHIEGRRLDHRADIFSLGTVLYTLAVGDLPFRANTAHALFRNILEANYVPAVRARPAVGEVLSEVIARCMRRNPEERYQSCAELERDIRSYVAAFGFDDPARELARYFQDPAVYEARATEEVVQRLVEHGRTLVRQKKLGGALRTFDRALALDGDRQDVLAEIERLRRGVEIRRFLVRYALPVAAASLLAAAGIWGALNYRALFGSAPEVEAAAREASETENPESRERVTAAAGPVIPVAAGVRTADTTRNLPAAPIRGAAAAGPATPAVRKTAAERVAAATLARGKLPAVGLRDLYHGTTSCVDALEEAQAAASRHVYAPPAEGGTEAKDPGGNEPEVARDPEKDRQKEEDRKAAAERAAAEKAAAEKAAAQKAAEGGGQKSETALAAALVPVTILASPPRCEIHVDGQRVGTGKVVDLPLAVGEHTARVHCPDCPECEDGVKPFQLHAGAQDLKYRVSVALKPAVLRVRSQRGGMVFVNGEYKGRTNQRLTLAAAGREPWNVSLKVVFDQSGVPHYEGSAQVQPGKAAVLRIDAE